MPPDPLGQRCRGLCTQIARALKRQGSYGRQAGVLPLFQAGGRKSLFRKAFYGFPADLMQPGRRVGGKTLLQALEAREVHTVFFCNGSHQSNLPFPNRGWRRGPGARERSSATRPPGRRVPRATHILFLQAPAPVPWSRISQCGRYRGRERNREQYNQAAAGSA